jgi:hypothetical protein
VNTLSDPSDSSGTVPGDDGADEALLPCGKCGATPGLSDECLCSECGAVLVSQADVDDLARLGADNDSPTSK